MNKVVAFIKSRFADPVTLYSLIVAVVIMVTSTIVLAVTSHEHSLLIAILGSITTIGFVVSQIGYKGSSGLVFAAFVLLAILCLFSLFVTYGLERSNKLVGNLGIFMAIMSYYAVMDSMRIAWRITQKKGQEDLLRMVEEATRNQQR